MIRILIADDDFAIGMQLEEMLMSLGYVVVGQAGSGQESIEMARDLRPDIILMDIMMPGELNGIQAAEKIKAEWNVPIIFVSGYGDPGIIQEAKRIEPYGCVIKPFDENEIKASVEIALHKHKMESELDADPTLLRRLMHPEDLGPASHIVDLAIAERNSFTEEEQEQQDQQRQQLLKAESAGCMAVTIADLLNNQFQTVQKVIRQPEQPAQLSSVKESGTVLVIDDESQIRQLTARMLSKLDFRVIEARDGIEGVERFQTHQNEIRCVICDLAMPHMDGWKTLSALRKLSPGIPVILVSGYDQDIVMAGNHPEWPQAFLKKPYSLMQLHKAMCQVVSGEAENRGEVED